MNKMVQTLANLKKISSGESTKAKHEVYTRPKAAPKLARPEINRRFIWKLFQKYAPPGFIIDGSNEDLIYTILLYFLKDQNFNKYNIVKNFPSLNKGLLIYGDLGVGKTELFKIIRCIGKDLCKYNFYDFWFRQISAGSFVEDYMASSRLDTIFSLEDFYKGKLYIDDLGYEKKAFNKDEVLGDLLFERNRLQSITFVTTNFTPKELSDKYGQRIGDRLPEMFNILSWRGESFRK